MMTPQALSKNSWQLLSVYYVSQVWEVDDIIFVL